MTPLQVKRGEIYLAMLDPVIGSETGKTRPVLIVQNDIGNRYSPTTIVAVVTEYSEKKAAYPICVAVGRMPACGRTPSSIFPRSEQSTKSASSARRSPCSPRDSWKRWTRR